MDKIHKVSYIENGYFKVKYNKGTVVQDLQSIKMTCTTDKSIKNIIMFLRTLKLEKLQDEENFDDVKYRDHIVYDNSEEIEAAKKASQARMKALSGIYSG